MILWVNIRVRPPPSWNSVFGTTWLRFSSRSRFRTRARNLVRPQPDDIPPQHSAYRKVNTPCRHVKMSWGSDNRTRQPHCYNRLSKTSGILWIRWGALTNQLCSLLTGGVRGVGNQLMPFGVHSALSPTFFSCYFKTQSNKIASNHQSR